MKITDLESLNIVKERGIQWFRDGAGIRGGDIVTFLSPITNTTTDEEVLQYVFGKVGDEFALRLIFFAFAANQKTLYSWDPVKGEKVYPESFHKENPIIPPKQYSKNG